MRKSRLFAFMGLLALTTLGSILVLNLHPGSLASVKATAQSTGLAYLPEDSDFVVHVYVNRALNSPLFTRLFSDPAAQRQLEMMVQETGLDPRQDISEVLVGGKTRGGDPVAFVRGALLRDKVQAFIARKEELQVKTEAYKGFDLTSLGAVNGLQGPPPALVFFDQDLLGVGDLRALKSAIDVLQGATPSVLSNNKIMGLLGNINQADTIWLATTNGDFSLPPIKELQSMPFGKARVRNLVLSGNLDVGISGKIFGFFDDAETAQNFAKLGRFLLEMGRMRGNQEPDLASLLDGLRIDDSQNQVILSVQIPLMVVEKMLNQGRQVVTIGK